MFIKAWVVFERSRKLESISLCLSEKASSVYSLKKLLGAHWSQNPSVIKLGIGDWNFKCA